ncbi:protein phosphatase 1 regulatory subunit 32 isoform X2 [Acanthopagrus latus]|nr:protein phosphatase 1 regulatory subunit 32 isoform X2 [Acanthopagrus latus]XP_036964408.1 protein phosphatase 1 regulatory subunit 32 isoform X2 [Acanthopagrus latus]XP_036964409.1 protein phosphatase 1 regulatory subunit 32 isoform X2 [Acanthopagrus latus]XP_036964410.1 protein phosphatase 1 regulatory subunit 32 isoform X2 [Acanthopagrus latus]
MAEQERTTAGATGSRGRLTSSKLCNTSYWETYCERVQDQSSMNLSPFLGHPSGTGFTANQRPVVFYRPSLDHVDNPQFGLLLSDNYKSQTKRHYRPHIQPDYYSGPLPNLVNEHRRSGFHQLKSLPKTVTAEAKTEYQRLFVPHPLTSTVSQNLVTLGPKGKTGFTEETDRQPFTFQDRESCAVESRQTHSSVTKTDFMPPTFLQFGVTEARPGLCRLSSRETGFTRGAIAPLACPSSLLPWKQTQSKAPTLKTIGKKEPTGALLNAPSNQIFPEAPYDRSDFTTHYKSMFCHCADTEELKSGHTPSGIYGVKMDSGYNRRDTDRFILTS